MSSLVNKRIVGTVIIKDNWAVQSFGYKEYLPLGKPSCLIENLDRWGADEIIVMCIDQSTKNSGPNFNLLKDLSKLGLSTSLVYAGGIRNSEDASMVIRYGADRVCLDQIYYENPNEIRSISDRLGAQAVILSLPCQIISDQLFTFNYQTKEHHKIKTDSFREILNYISEVLLIDHISEGFPGKFNTGLVDTFPSKFPLITYGGIWGENKIRSLAKFNNVSAIAIGNPLNFQESSVNKIKEFMNSENFRQPIYSKNGINIDYE